MGPTVSVVCITDGAHRREQACAPPATMSPPTASSSKYQTGLLELKWRPDLRQGWVAGLDIGTSRTCVSFARCPLPEDPPECLAINTKPLIDAGARDLELKTKTAVLLGPGPEHPLIAFGYEAEDRYVSALEEEEEEGEHQEENQHQRPRNLLFTEWKMALAPPTAGTRRRCSPESVMYPSQCGTAEVPLLLLFQRTMEHAAKTVLEELFHRYKAGQKSNEEAEEHATTGRPERVVAHDLLWCLTVPAGWDDYSKGFMRRAAFQAGLLSTESGQNLSFCYEPEGAFLGTLMAESRLLAIPGTRVMIVDAGGGTIDIAFQEVCSVAPLELRDVARPQMDATLGSTAIDRYFEWWLVGLLGLEGDWAEAVTRTRQWRQDVMRQFESNKKHYNDVRCSSFRLKLGGLIEEVLGGTAQFDLSERIAMWNSSQSLERQVSRSRISATTVVLPRSVIQTFFHPVVREVGGFAKQVFLQSPAGCDLCITVGGFGESKVLTDQLQKVLPMPVVSTSRASVSIVRGAILHALTQSVRQRVLQRTYGLEVSVPFSPALHGNREGEVEVINGERMIQTFTKLISKGQTVATDHALSPIGPFGPVTDTQTKATFRFMVSDAEEDPKTPTGGIVVGTVTVALDMGKPSAEERVFFVELRLGGTEIEAVILDEARQPRAEGVRMQFC